MLFGLKKNNIAANSPCCSFYRKVIKQGENPKQYNKIFKLCLLEGERFQRQSSKTWETIEM